MSLLSDMRDLVKDSSIYGLSAGFSRMVSLFMAPILTRIFVPAEYGIIALVQLAISFLVIIASMNIMSGMSYYYYQEDNAEKQRSILSTGLVFTTIISMIIALFMGAFSEQIAALLEIRSEGPIEGYDLALYLRIGAASLFFSLLLSGVQSIMRLLRKPQDYLKTDIINVLLQIGSVLILVVWLRIGVVGVFWANLIASIAACFIGGFLVRKHLSSKLSFVILPLMLAYALPQLPGVLINWGQSQLGRVFLNYYSDMAELGLYSIGFAISSILTLCVTAFRMAYDPYSLSVMKQSRAKSVYARVYDFYGAFFCWLFAGIALFAKPILMLLTPVEYHQAYGFVLVLSAAGFYMGANNILATGIWISKKTSRTSYAQAISFCVLLILNIILVPKYGGIGAAVAYLGGVVAQSFSYYVFAQQLWPVAYKFYRVHLQVLLVFALCFIHNSLIENMSFLSSLLLCAVSGISITVFLWFFAVSKNERSFAVEAFNDWRRKALRR